MRPVLVLEPPKRTPQPGGNKVNEFRLLGVSFGRRAPGALLAAIAAMLVIAAGCGKSGRTNADGATIDARDGGTDGDARPDGVAVTCQDGGSGKTNGQACACASDCASGFCVDGVCCNTACTAGCMTCKAEESPGVCVGIQPGGTPRTASTCVATPESECGLDGKCDGAGGCRKHVAGTVCKAGTCEGDAVVGLNACDGAGRCKPGATVICVPSSCNQATGMCFDKCTTNAQCVSGRQCQAGSCGRRMKGARCEQGADCVSGFCANGVCCNVACDGPCVSCALPSREGTCWPTDPGTPDPNGVCRNMGAASCGQSGLCDGLGGCAKFPRDTLCTMPSCSGNKRNTPGTCNGVGVCSAPGIQDCYPFACAAGACKTTCATDADCDQGIACVNRSCGPKRDGQLCSKASECLSNFCVDGVCCENACAGACRSCSMESSLGKCMPVVAGNPDPRAMCAVHAQSTCGTNGRCDGNMGCQKHPVNTVCAAETCVSNVYTPASMCNASGQCVAPDSLPCAPFGCNVNKCFTVCTTSAQCVAPNTCAANSCGLKPNGASCTEATECKSTFCAQGVCCDQACTAACKSCVAGTLGVCSNIATGTVDPQARCPDQGAASCGTNGRCQAGACQRYDSGTPCRAASCATATDLFTETSTCDGSGTCVTPAVNACFPYRCDATACRASCTADTHCKPPATCVNGTCGLKPPGATCFGPQECLDGFCQQGVCCRTSCDGVCKSCALTASRGTCANIAPGDTDARCSDMGPTSCGTDGLCDGNGACHRYDASTSCAPPSCPANQSMLVTGRMCDGRGTCLAASSIACAPYVCNGTTACHAACTTDAQCLAPTICDPQTNRCGNKQRLGQACTTNDQCLTGNFCVDGVCCSTMSCGLCQACNVGTGAGNCAPVLSGNPEPRGGCAASPPCGNTGACNGAGDCLKAAATVSCGTASCSGSTFTAVSHCTGSGTCAPANTGSCSPYMCSGTACGTSCTADSNCIAPFTCQGTAPNRSCALKPNGQQCANADQCISGNCVDGVCCGSAVCGTCQRCNLAGNLGMCADIPAGTAAPAGQCPAAPPCGNTGACNGAGDCQKAAASVSCGLAASCSGSMMQPASFCSGSGACNQTTATSCGMYVCNTNSTCRTDCTSDAHCADSSLYCTGAPGVCAEKKALGATCSIDRECSSAFCTDGVCCNADACGTCEACNRAGNLGMCTNIPAGGAAPAGQCTAAPPCGNTGACNGSGGCQVAAATVSCGAGASCPNAMTHQPASHCSGSGTCTQPPTESCGAFVCSGSSCRTSCTGNEHCASGYTCTGGTCVSQTGLGTPCSSSSQCVSGFCTNGVCCNVGSCGACKACNLNGAGTCANVDMGTPDPGCAPNGTCGNTGACNASGACAQQPSSVPCGTATCSGTTHQPTSHCTGSGACAPVDTESCVPYVCGASACLTSCNGNEDCVSSHFCNGTSCVSKNDLGASCNDGGECVSGFCTDGVCCNLGSCGTCRACNLVTNPGTCTNVPDNGAAPAGQCAANPPCGNTGACNGSGGCQQAAASVVCGVAASCSVATYQPASHCNGSGSCNQVATESCSPYACGQSVCLTGCSNDDQCDSSSTCVDGGCVAKQANGSNCTSDGECSTGNCVDGFCCGSASCPSCQSCGVNGSQGTCTNLPIGSPDPTGFCADQGAASCGTTGLCNGAGNCQRYAVGTPCFEGCEGKSFRHKSCDDAGMCVMIDMQNCAPGMCAASGCVP